MRKDFCALFIAFLESAFEHFHKEMSPIAKVFMTVLALKDVLTYMYKRSCFYSKRVKVQKMFNQNILCFSSESHGIRDTKV